MGDSKVLERLRGFCEAYKAEFTFEGVVEGFDTLPLIDPERLTRGMFVKTEDDTRQVVFRSNQKHPVEIGNHVIVVGRDAIREKNSVYPAAILDTSDYIVHFPKDLRKSSMTSNTLWGLPQLIGLLIVLIPFLIVPGEYVLLHFLGWLIFLGSSCLSTILKDYRFRPKSYSCDASTWKLLINELSSRFDITLTD